MLPQKTLNLVAAFTICSAFFADIANAQLRRAYLPKTTKDSFVSILNHFRFPGDTAVFNSTQFRAFGVPAPEVLTLRVQEEWLQRILLGEEKFDFRELSAYNNMVLNRAIAGGAKYLRLHSQDPDIQILARITRIDHVPVARVSEHRGARSPKASQNTLTWRIGIRNPKLIWRNPRSMEYARQLSLTFDVDFFKAN